LRAAGLRAHRGLLAAEHAGQPQCLPWVERETMWLGAPALITAQASRRVWKNRPGVLAAWTRRAHWLKQHELRRCLKSSHPLIPYIRAAG